MTVTNYSALGTPPDANGNGVSAHAHRRIMRYLWSNPGIVGQDPHDLSLRVNGRSDLQYSVTRGMCVIPRDESWAEGFYEAYVDQTVVGPVAAGDATHPRIDVVWIRANNKPEYGSDLDNQVHVGVTQGTPAASPVRPTVPQGCTPIAWRLMPAGATSTQSATSHGSVDYAIPYGSNLGRLAEHWWKQDYAGTGDVKKMFYEQQVSFVVPTDRLCDFDFKVSLSADGVPWESTANRTEWSFCFQLDNQDIPHSGGNFVAYGAWQTFQIIHTSEVPAGRHTARLRCWLQNGVPPHFHYTGDDSMGRQWVGRRFQIFDRGPVQ